MAIITEDACVITINHSTHYTYAVVTPTTFIEFESRELAHEWMPRIAARHVSNEDANVHSINKISNLKLTNPEFFKR